MEDTIVAISTSLGVGAISIVRLSGTDAIKIVESVFSNRNLSQKPSHTIHYGHIIDGKKIIDEVLVSIMKSPKTFTKEDVVEINCHGGITTTNKILELLLTKGCRLAEPGEFTKRAFLNGRIDLLEAEAVMDIINSKTEDARKMAINQLSGSVSELIRNLRSKIVNVLAKIEVNIDYPEYEENEEVTLEEIAKLNKEIEEKLENIIKNSENGKIIKEGLKVAIVGRPNVGKSSLLNRLLEEEKAIVTEIEGTTRDIVEGTLNLDGILLNLYDTAGIRETKDKVESIGVSKSLNLIEEADLVLFLLNNNESLTKEDEEILEKIKNKPYIIVVNKIDLEPNLDLKTFTDSKPILVSVKNNDGISELKTTIKEIFNLEKIKTTDMTYLTNSNDIAILKVCLKETKEINESILDKTPTDLIEINLKNIWNLLGTITGDVYDEELIDQLFIQFCLGK